MAGSPQRWNPSRMLSPILPHAVLLPLVHAHMFSSMVCRACIYICCVWCQACVAAHTACNVVLGMHVLMAWQLWMLVCNYVSHYTCNIWCGCCHTSAVTSNAACWCRIFAIRNPGHCCRHPASTHTWCCEMHLKKTKLKHAIACKQLAPAAILSWHTSQSNFWSQSCCWWQCLFTSWFNLATYICFCQEFHQVCIWRITCRPCTQRWSWCASTTLWKFLKFCIKKVNEKGLTACRPHTQRWSWCASTMSSWSGQARCTSWQSSLVCILTSTPTMPSSMPMAVTSRWGQLCLFTSNSKQHVCDIYAITAIYYLLYMHILLRSPCSIEPGCPQEHVRCLECPGDYVQCLACSWALVLSATAVVQSTACVLHTKGKRALLLLAICWCSCSPALRGPRLPAVLSLSLVCAVVVVPPTNSVEVLRGALKEKNNLRFSAILTEAS